MSTLICPVIAVAVNAIAQVIVFRLRRGMQYFRSIIEGVFAGAVAFVILEAIFAIKGIPFNGIATILLVDAPTYFALSYCTYSFVQLGQTSIRIRMYAEIAANPSGISVEEMNREYDDQRLIDMRLRRLTESGDIIEKDGRYYVGRKKFLYVSNILFGAKRFLLGKESEFE